MALVKKFLPGLVALVITYVLLSIVRDLRDLFIANIWKENHYDKIKDIFTSTENKISLVVLVVIGMMILIKDNFKAFMFNHFMVGLGFMMAGENGRDVTAALQSKLAEIEPTLPAGVRAVRVGRA